MKFTHTQTPTNHFNLDVSGKTIEEVFQQKAKYETLGYDVEILTLTMQKTRDYVKNPLLGKFRATLTIYENVHA